MPDQCSQLLKLPEHVRKFWEDKQRELEDTLIRFWYAILTVPSQVSWTEKSGLLYLMKKNLWFEDFPKSSPFFFIGSRTEYKKTLIQMPLATMEHFKIIRKSALQELFQEKKPRSGVLQDIFQWIGADPMYLLVSGKQATGGSFQYAFRELDDPASWVQTLSELLETRG